MSADIELTCSACRNKFWSTADLSQTCEACRGKEELHGKPPHEATQLVPAEVLAENADFLKALRYWVKESYVVRPTRKATLRERLTGDTPQAQEERRRQRAAESVEGLMEEEETILRKATKLYSARAKAEATIIRAQNEAIKAAIERVQLQKTLRESLEQPTTKAIAGPKKRKTRKTNEQEPLDPEVKKLATRERRQRQAQSAVRQGIITDFLREVERICADTTEVHEKALRIRNLMAAFEMDEEALPEHAARLLVASERLKRGA